MVYFQTKNANLGNFLECLEMNDVGKFYGHLVYLFTAIWYIVCPFGIFAVSLVYFSRFGMLYQEKSGNPDYDCSCYDQGDQIGRIFAHWMIVYCR
jgi:hypothetical protein